ERFGVSQPFSRGRAHFDFCCSTPAESTVDSLPVSGADRRFVTDPDGRGGREAYADRLPRPVGPSLEPTLAYDAAILGQYAEILPAQADSAAELNSGVL